jgi:Pro-kumamolisin, activation domain/FG-GAP-like repeat/FG-GAP repeat/Subtilase family
MLTQKYQPWFAVAGLALGVAAPIAAGASTTTQNQGYLPAVPQDQARITSAVDDSQRSTLTKSHSSLAVAAYDKGALPDTQTFPDLLLVLKRSAAKQQAFDDLLQQQANPSSPYFHHWVTASQIGTMYAPQQSDIAKVTKWLQSRGLQVKSVSSDGLIIHFSGNVAAVNGAFNASMHSYEINGEKHFANANAAQIPTALTPVVQSVTLHNFFPKPQHIDVATVSKDKATGRWKTVATAAATGTHKPMPQFTVPGGTVDPSTAYELAPADFNTVYNVNPLWSQGTRGAGQTIVVLERTDINLADVATFRHAFLPANAKGTVTIEHPGGCTDPGVNGDEGEAALDAEWAGAAAPDANIVVAACEDSDVTFGAMLAAIELNDSASPGDIWSLSYGECEASAGDATITSFVWQEAEAKGVTVFVASDDAGSAGCDQNEYAATGGAQVNSLASTPYDVAVGGTDFNDFGNYNQYWLSTNLPLDSSAISYVPEQTWNDSCASSQLDELLGYANGLAACNDVSGPGGEFLNTAGGGGGASMYVSQPEWQEGVYGQTNSSTRTLPDVSLFAANGLYGHALVYCMSDTTEGGNTCDYTNSNDVVYNSAGGTSFAAPAMAGVQALINQVQGAPSGNILPALYNIAIKQYGTNASPNTAMLTSCNSSNGANIGSNCVFNNVTVGNNDVPCWSGSANCYLGSNSIDGLQEFGLVYGAPSANATTTVPAWSAGAGYNMATGLGSVNATNLVNAVAKFNQTFADRATPYVAPYDFLSASVGLDNSFSNDGFSDIALVDPVKGSFTALAMKGSVVRAQTTLSISPGYTIGTAADFFPLLDLLGLRSAHLAWTGPDNKLYVWISNDQGGFYPYGVGSAYPEGWKLMGSEVIDNSGTPQMLWYNASTSQIGWWKLTTNLATGAPLISSMSTPFNVASGYVPTLADLNGDGYGDLVWTNPSNNDVYAWINNQQGGYVPHLLSVSRPDGFTLTGAGDFTGTGITDLVWVNTSTHQLQIWMMNGFNVTSQKTITYTAGYTLASIADYDGDGLADLLWVGTAGDVYDWQSNGNGGFQSLRVAAVDGTPFVVPAGEQVQGNWLQGSANGGVANPEGLDSH